MHLWFLYFNKVELSLLSLWWLRGQWELRERSAVFSLVEKWKDEKAAKDLTFTEECGKISIQSIQHKYKHALYAEIGGGLMLEGKECY